MKSQYYTWQVAGLGEKIEKEPAPNLEGIVFHPKKLLCLIDLLGVKDFFSEIKDLDQNSRADRYREKLGTNFFELLRSVDMDIYSVHWIGDSALIVPKSVPRNGRPIPTYKEFLNLIFGIYVRLLAGSNPNKVLITRGDYFSFVDQSVLPGGQGYLDCFLADKDHLKGVGPGIFTNLADPEQLPSSPSDWKPLNLSDLVRLNNISDDVLSQAKKNLEHLKNEFSKTSAEKAEKSYIVAIEQLDLLSNQK
jgi:hypothetical protein